MTCSPSFKPCAIAASKGLSQTELAKIINTILSMICLLEVADYDRHSLSILSRIAQALGREIKIELLSTCNSAETSLT